MNSNIPNTGQKRVVIAGGGFAGLKLAHKLSKSNFQVVLIDKNNYHQFQPLYYQVATAGLEPSSISFPLRKVFQNSKNVFIRLAEILSVDPFEKLIHTTIGKVSYDYLVLALGTTTNFFGNHQLEENSIPMKSVAEALALRNQILQNFEDALTSNDDKELEQLITLVVVGGGPTGVEVSGTLAEMRKYILPKDYPEIDFSKMQIHLLEAGDRLLAGMSEKSSKKAHKYLKRLGVTIHTNCQVLEYDGERVLMKNDDPIHCKILLWAAGVTGNLIEGLPKTVFTRGNRLKVNAFNQVEGFDDIFALGDIAFMTEKKYPNGHPQMAQPAIQQAKLLAKNLQQIEKKKSLKPFHYTNKGTMATIGRNLAVVDLPFIHFYGFFAWVTWMFVHLMAIVGVKNRLMIFINWFWNYVTYDQSLRLIIKPFLRNKLKKAEELKHS